jgi:hypothetical protein
MTLNAVSPITPPNPPLRELVTTGGRTYLIGTSANVTEPPRSIATVTRRTCGAKPMRRAVTSYLPGFTSLKRKTPFPSLNVRR